MLRTSMTKAGLHAVPCGILVQQARRDAEPDLGDAMMRAGAALRDQPPPQGGLTLDSPRLQTTCVQQGVYTMCR
jgi:hypothetical protein